MLSDRIRHALIFLIGFVLPQEHLNLAVGGFAGVLTPNKIVNGLALAYVGLFWAIRGSSLPRNPKHMWVLFFSMSVGVSFLASLFQGVELRPLAGVVITYVSLFLFYIVMASIVQTRSDIDLVLKGLAVGVIVVVASAGLGAGNVYETRFGARTGAYGGNANQLAYNLVIGIPLVATLLLSTRNGLSRTFYLGVIGLCLAGIAITLSRSGAVALAVMASFWMVRTRRTQYILPMLVIGVTFLLLVPDTWFERIGQISLDPEDKSAQDRILILPSIFHAFGSSPLVGVGLLRFLIFTFEQGYTVHHVIHNAFLSVLAEQGLLGFVPFVAIHLFCWRDFARSRRTARRLRMHREPELQALEIRAQLFQVAFVGAMVVALFQPSQAHKGLWLMFAISTVMWAMTKQQAQIVLESAAESARPSGRGALSPMGVPGRLDPGPTRA